MAGYARGTERIPCFWRSVSFLPDVIEDAFPEHVATLDFLALVFFPFLASRFPGKTVPYVVLMITLDETTDFSRCGSVTLHGHFTERDTFFDQVDIRSIPGRIVRLTHRSDFGLRW